MTRREHTLLVIVGALRDVGDVQCAQAVDHGAFAWVTDRTVEVDGERYTDADCGCVLSWRADRGERLPTHGRVLKDCAGADGHLPHEMIVGGEANETSRDGAV